VSEESPAAAGVPAVAFDVTPALAGGTGIARYVNQVGAELERQGVELRRFAYGRASFPVPAGTRHLRIPARALSRSWRAFPWPTAEQLAGGGAVVHATGLVVPPTRLPLVVTVHDIAAVVRPDLHPPRDVRQLRLQLAALQRAAAVIAVSEATAQALAELGVARSRLVVAPLGLTPLPDRQPVTGLPARYLLTVGETSPRKGYSVLLEALARAGCDIELVMAGPPASDEQHLRSLADELGIAPRIKRLGAVTDGELATLYAEATALCFPSVAEGFGLPVLEAMAAGTPVLASDIPPLRELLAGSGVLVDSEDAGAWAAAIDTVVGDEQLRRRVSDAERAQAARYTWERTAAATLRAYQLALGVAGSAVGTIGANSVD
jgi:glycosyltransferase involved in cell wall biosynthesis